MCSQICIIYKVHVHFKPKSSVPWQVIECQLSHYELEYSKPLIKISKSPSMSVKHWPVWRITTTSATLVYLESRTNSKSGISVLKSRSWLYRKGRKQWHFVLSDSSLFPWVLWTPLQPDMSPVCTQQWSLPPYYWLMWLLTWIYRSPL